MLLQFDMGGENVDETLRSACADLNVATEYSTTDRKAAGERTHGLLLGWYGEPGETLQVAHWTRRSPKFSI